MIYHSSDVSMSADGRKQRCFPKLIDPKIEYNHGGGWSASTERRSAGGGSFYSTGIGVQRGGEGARGRKQNAGKRHEKGACAGTRVGKCRVYATDGDVKTQ